MSPILHITSQADWAAAQVAGSYTADSLASQGFIHCSTAEQVLLVANSFFRGRNDLLLLEIDPARLSAELRYEESEPGMLFPHIYGPLNLDAVTAAYTFTPDSTGVFSAPIASRQ